MPNFHVAGANMGLTTLAQGAKGIVLIRAATIPTN